MERTTLDIAGGTYVSRSLPLSAQNCVNWVPVISESDDPSLSNRALMDVAGITSFAHSNPTYPYADGTGSNRGAMKMNDTPYFVQGNYLFSMAEDGTLTNIGYVSGSGRVSMANNGKKLVVVVPRDKAYVYDSDAGTFLAIVDPNYRAADIVVYKDGYFVYTASAGDVFFISELNQPATIDPLGFGTAEINPDKILGAFVDHNELFILGEDTNEIFQNIGGSGFPFQRIAGANFQKGVHARFSPTYFDNTFLFIGGGDNENSSIWKITGSSSVGKISTPAIDIALQKFNMNEIENAFGFSFSINGNFFACFTIESTRIPSRTFVYDATSSGLSGKHVWHERKTGLTQNRWCVESVTQAYGKLFVTDYRDGRIGVLDVDTHTEYSDRIYREKTSMPFYNMGKALYFSSIELTIEQGVGESSGDAENPMMQLEYSNDGARTFKSMSSRSMGKIGEYDKLLQWRGFGKTTRQRVVRFKCSEPVKANLLKLEGWIAGGTK